MACELEITPPVVGVVPDAAATPSIIRVSGTAIECEQVSVTLYCNGVELGTAPANVSAAGDWTVEFPTANQCGCNDPVDVVVSCVDDPSCQTKIADRVDCRSEGDCPLVSVSTAQSGCNPDGTRTVTFTVTVTPPPATQVVSQLDFGDATLAVATPATSYSVPHDYSTPGTYPARVLIVLPVGCPPEDVPVGPLTECPVVCPEVTGVSATVEGCLVTFVAATNPPSAVGTYTWDFGDGSMPPPTSVPTIPHTYSSSGMWTVQVTFVPSDPDRTCQQSTASADVTVGRCRPDRPDEDDGDGDGDGGWDWGWCRWLRVGFTISFILSALALLIAVCVPGAGWPWYLASVGSALIAAILLGIWRRICDQPCGWTTLLAWQVSLGSGIGALYFANCCWGLWWIGGALIAAAVGLLYKWKKDCRRTWCDVWAELLVVISAVILPVIGWLAEVKIFRTCSNPWVNGSVGVLSTIVTLAASQCLTPREEVSPIDEVRR